MYVGAVIAAYSTGATLTSLRLIIRGGRADIFSDSEPESLQVWGSEPESLLVWGSEPPNS